MDNPVLDTPTPPDPWAALDAELDSLDLIDLLERLMARTGQTVPQMAISAEIEQPVLYKILNGENREFKATHADRLLEDLATQGVLADPAEAAVWRKWLHVAAYVHFEEYKAALPRLARITDLQERLAALAEHLRQQYQALAQTYERTGGQFPAGIVLADLAARRLHERYGWIRVPVGCKLHSGDAEECVITRFRVTGEADDFGPDAEATRIEPGRWRVRRKGAPVRVPAQTPRPDIRFEEPAQHLDRRETQGCIEPEMVLIPGGAFQMGLKPEEEYTLRSLRFPWEGSDSKPTHSVYVSAFWMARFPVTYGEYRIFVEGAQGYFNRQWWSDEVWSWISIRRGPHGWEKRVRLDRYPVTEVTWYEASAYCAWLSATSGREYRLPREAEWEKAARGPSGTLWPWGDSWEATRCGHAFDQGTTAVDRNPNGAARWHGGPVEDLLGNVNQWCADWYDSSWYAKPEARHRDCPGPKNSRFRVLRGGPTNFEVVCHNAFRDQNTMAMEPDFTTRTRDFVSFRVVRSP